MSEEQLTRALYETRNSMDRLANQQSYSQQSMEGVARAIQEANLLLQQLITEIQQLQARTPDGVAKEKEG